MYDETEHVRRAMVAELNSEQAELGNLEQEHGRVWSTAELCDEFEVLGFMAPFVVVRRKLDGHKGSLMFQHSPRFYFGWKE